MAVGAQQQQTFTLLLKAQDQATSAIQDVHGALQKLGAGTDLTDLSTQLHTLGADMADVSRSMGPLTEAIERGFAAQADAARTASGEMGSALASLGADLERVGPEATEAASAIEKVGHAAEGGGGPLARFAEFGKQMVVWNVGYAAVNKMTEAIGNFAGGLVGVNANLEEYQQTFTAVYQSSQKGQAAVDWLTDFAAKVPATREQVIQAGLAVASLGDNVTQVMPALSNISAVMGVDMPRAAQAFADAQMGRFQMLQTTLHITKEELVAYGLQLDSSGHVLNNSFVPAFEKLGQVRFAAGAALQMDTFTGKMSNVQDALTKLQEVMGKPIFDLLKHQLDGLIAFLGRGDVQRWALAVGEAIGHMLADAMRAAQWMMANFGPPLARAVQLVAAAWQAAQPAIASAIATIQLAMTQVGTFLQHSVLPVVEQALGQMVTWWNQNKDQIATVLNAILGAWNAFAGSLQQNLANDLNIVHGIWDVEWSLVSGSFSAILDVMTGNWKKFGDDLNNMATGIAVGILEVFKGLVDKTIDVVSHLADPINAIMHAEYDASRFLAGAVFDMWNNLPTLILQSFDRLLSALPTIEQRYVHWLLDLDKHAAEALRGINPFAAHRGAGGGGSSGFGTVDDLATAAAADARTARQKFVDQISFGWAPQTNLAFGRTSQQAQSAFNAQVDAWIDQIKKSPNLFTGAPSTYGSAAANASAGKTFLEQLSAWLGKHQIALPALAASGGGAGTSDLSMPGGAGGAAPTGKAAKDLAQAAKDAFDLLLEKGPATWAAGMQDIARIALAEHAAKTPDSQVMLDVLRDTKQLVDKLLGQAQKQFDFDAHVAHPSIQRLHQDEANYLAILAKTPGITPIDIATARQSMDQQITSLFKTSAGGQMPAVPSPAYGTYGGLATGYGQTTVSFGGTQQSGWAAVVAELRAQLAFWRARALAEQRQLEGVQQTAQNTAQIARNTQPGHSAGHEPVYPSAAPAAAALRGAGGFQVLRRV